MTNTRLFTAALLAASALTVATPASAQRVDRIVAVGDSYADDGNAFQLGYNNPSALAVYPTGRFSGGQNYVDVLSQILSAPVENFAIGGALASQNNTLICFDAPYGTPLCGKGFQYEVDQFLNVGTQSSAFPNGATTFSEGDLLTVSIGGNDARLYQQTGGTLAGAPTAGAATAAAAKAQLDRLVAAGAPTISFLAGDTGRLPEIAGNAAGAAVRSSFSASFNGAMQQTLAGYAANGVMVHYLDLSKVLDNIIANPTAYGITSGLVCPTFPNTTCVVSSSGYLFYGDALHLTTDGFRIVAAYIATQLEAPLTLQAPSDIGLDTARQWGRTLTNRLDSGSPRDGGEANGVRFFLTGDSSSRRLDATDRNDEYRASMWGATAGVEVGFGSGGSGLSLNHSKPRANFGNASIEVQDLSIRVRCKAGLR